MRYPIIAFAAFLAASATGTPPAGAQPAGQRGRLGTAHVPPPVQVPAGATRPPIPAPTLPPTVAPPITLPLPPLMTPPAGGLTRGFPFVPSDLTRPPRDLFRARRSDRFRSLFFTPFVTGYAGYAGPVVEESRPAQPAPATGLLRLSVTPTTAQVFVDGFYVGTVDDINAQRALVLEAGPHRLEFRSEQYQTLVVDVRIAAYETVTYRGALEPLRPAVAVAPAPVSSSPMYLIPNCYLGNVPPRAARLPSGCDIRQVQVLGAANQKPR